MRHEERYFPYPRVSLFLIPCYVEGRITWIMRSPRLCGVRCVISRESSVNAGCIRMGGVVVLRIIWWLLMGVSSLQRLQELQQFVVGPEAEGATGWGLKCFEGFFFQFEISGYISVCRFNTFMAQPQSDNGDVHARLEKVHGVRVAQSVRRDPLRTDRRAGLSGLPHMRRLSSTRPFSEIGPHTSVGTCPHAPW